MRRVRFTNSHLRRLIHVLGKYSRQYNAPVWRDVAEYLSRPRRKQVEVNLSKINRYTEEGDTVVVPGKVLGCGVLAHKVTVAAWEFSREAYEKIESVGKALTIEELLQRNPEGSSIKVIT